MNDAVVVDNLVKEYRLYNSSFSRLKEALSFGRKSYHRSFRALDGVSFRLPSGKALGVIGENGAGKSTLLKVLAGTSMSTGGTVTIKGTVASLLELGTGFHQEFTGRSNIYLAAQVQGFKLAQIEEKIDSIIDFAELGDYIDQPVRTYSSGMVMRLGFAVATAIDPDVLIIDEILAVGDLYFQKKCVDRIFEFREAGKSILFCSHSLYDVRQICDEVIWIKDGKVELRGTPQDVTVAYANYERALTTDPEATTAGKIKVTGEGLPAMTGSRMLLTDTDREPVGDTLSPGTNLTYEIDFVIREPGHVLNLGMAIFRNDNILVASFTTTETDLPSLFETGQHRACLSLPALALLEGEYNVVGYLLDETGIHFYDHRQLEKPLLIKQEQNQPGVVMLDHVFSVHSLDSTS